MRSLLAHILKNNVDKLDGYELRDWSYIYAMMDIFYNHFRVKKSTAIDAKNYKYAKRIAEISRIIQNRYTENLTLNELAEKMHLSVPYLSKFFAEQFGMNFLSCLNQYRLNHAVHELLSTDMNIDEIAVNAGFANSHAFVSAFKKEYSILPNVYRREAKKKVSQTPQEAPLQHNYISGLAKYLNQDQAPILSPAGRTSDITLSIGNVGVPLRHTWKEIVTVSSASDLLLSNVQTMLREFQSVVGFHYIKIQDIFSDVLSVYQENAEGEPIYCMAYIDILLDFVLSIGLKPWLQLSYMPVSLAKYPGHRLFGSIVSEPKDIDKWCALCENFMTHILNRYGKKEIASWRFLIWNQPNTGTELYGFSDEKIFYKFYKKTHAAIKSIAPMIQICAPASYYIILENFENWYIHFLNWARKEDCMLDALNFTYYDTKLLEDRNHSKESFGFVHTMALSENPDGLKEFVMQVLRERKEIGLEDMPIYLSEWNNSPSQQDLLNDTCYKSCYIAKNILENYDRLDAFGFWSLTDLMNEAAIPQKLFFGGIGLFTKNGIPKASYNAFILLSKLGDELLGRGDGYFLTRSNHSYQLFLYNYEHFSHLYANGERFDMTERNRYTPFAMQEAHQFDLTLGGFAPGCSYKFNALYVNRHNGSAFDKWLESGGIEPDNPEETAFLKSASAPGYYQKIISADESGNITLQVTMDLLEIRLIEIRKIS